MEAGKETNKINNKIQITPNGTKLRKKTNFNSTFLVYLNSNSKSTINQLKIPMKMENSQVNMTRILNTL